MKINENHDLQHINGSNSVPVGSPKAQEIQGINRLIFLLLPQQTR